MPAAKPRRPRRLAPSCSHAYGRWHKEAPPAIACDRCAGGEAGRHRGARARHAIQCLEAGGVRGEGESTGGRPARRAQVARDRRKHAERDQRLRQDRRRRAAVGRQRHDRLARPRARRLRRAAADDEPGRAGRRQPELAEGRPARPDAARGLHPPREDHALRPRAHPRAHRACARLGRARLLRVHASR